MSRLSLFMKTGYVNAPNANGIGRFVPQCQRMTLKFCKSHGASKGVRDFIQRDVVEFARKNPGIVLYLKPRRHRGPVVVAEYLNGGREWMSLHGMEYEEVTKWLDVLRTGAGYGSMVYKSYHHTDTPSIQGVWTPFTHKPFETNTMEFPHPFYAEPAHYKPSATEVLLQMAKNSNVSSSS